MIAFESVGHAEAQAHSLAEMADSLDCATAYSYEWDMANGGVPTKRIYCPMTRRACMGSNCAAARMVGEVWRCTAFNAAGGTMVELLDGTRAER